MLQELLPANPGILLMDEPFGAVDPINRANLQNEFMKLQKKLHTTVVLVTHDIGEAMKMETELRSWIRENYRALELRENCYVIKIINLSVNLWVMIHLLIF